MPLYSNLLAPPSVISFIPRWLKRYKNIQIEGVTKHSKRNEPFFKTAHSDQINIFLLIIFSILFGRSLSNPTHRDNLFVYYANSSEK